MKQLLEILHEDAPKHLRICLVGAGGKKSTMYAIAAAVSERVMLTSTSHMYRYREDEVDAVITVDEQWPDFSAVFSGQARNFSAAPFSGQASETIPGAIPGQATTVSRQTRVVAFAGPTDTPERVGGLQAQTIQTLSEQGEFPLCLIKGDGARARWIKAPADYEPLIPDFVDWVIPVVSARVMGRCLNDGIAHRPELVAAVSGARLDEPLRPEHIAELLTARKGALKGTEPHRVLPLINMVDNDAVAVDARAAAELALTLTDRFDRVVLACMRTPRIVGIVAR